MKKFREKASQNYQLRLRPNRDVENAFRAYETSWETERLESEENRQIYCELIDLGREEKLEKIAVNPDDKSAKPSTESVVEDDEDHEGQTEVKVGGNIQWWTKNLVETKQPKRLNEICIEEFTKFYKGGQIDSCITCQDSYDFGLLADVELPFLQLLEIDVSF